VRRSWSIVDSFSERPRCQAQQSQVIPGFDDLLEHHAALRREIFSALGIRWYALSELSKDLAQLNCDRFHASNVAMVSIRTMSSCRFMLDIRSLSYRLPNQIRELGGDEFLVELVSDIFASATLRSAPEAPLLAAGASVRAL
jgi:hypothetical protein